MSTDPNQKPKIIVDDNWKEKVQAERESLQKKEENPTPKEEHSEIPPASFPFLVSSMATQVLAELGQIPDSSGKSMVRFDHAKHVIDTLGMLEEKTRGNLTAEESAMLTQMLHELRMIFVAVRQQAAAAKSASPDAAK
jgi:hypothetical protein